MKRPTLNKVNPCARVISELAHVCFMIGEETEFDAHFSWSAHVNELQITLQPEGRYAADPIMALDEYVNIPTVAMWGHYPKIGEDTLPKLKAFLAELKKFHQKNLTE